jgi:type I site-specific restriction-modification system R (restriction) subunit
VKSVGILSWFDNQDLEAQKNLKKKFKKYYQFGFTGTPIFPQNALGAETTGSVQ